MKNIIIFGAPGSGKGTYSEEIVKRYGMNHISTGDVLRAEINSGSEKGKEIAAIINKGQLIPDEMIIKILADVYDKLGKDNKGVIFDGFPRTIPQAEVLEKALKELNDAISFEQSQLNDFLKNFIEFNTSSKK